MDEPGSLLRRSVVAVMALMIAVWIALYFLSFNDARGQAKPADFVFQGQSAKAGKKVFQAYNCMGCHTIVGNGAYFAPDLTDIVETAGPAWLAAYLPSAGTWPTEALLRIQIERKASQGLIAQDSLDAYYAAYPGARERTARRGGRSANMPNLAFRPDEVAALIAFLSYTSAMHTEGWPPKVQARPAVITQKRDLLHLRAAVGTSDFRPMTAPTALPVGSTETIPPGVATASAADRGRELAASYSCTACHSTGTNRVVGPGWQGLFGSERLLSDGSTVKVDDAYLLTAITDPDRQLPKGYAAGVMPSFAAQLKPGDVDALLAYIKSLGKGDR